MLNDLLGAQAAAATVREREKRLAALAEQYRVRVIELDQKTFTRADLERARSLNEEAYLLYHRKAQESDIVRALNREKIVNTSLAQTARPSTQPVSPKPLLNFAVLVVVGLLAAGAGALLKEWLNPLVRHEDEVRRRYKMRVLARIPDAVGAGLE